MQGWMRSPTAEFMPYRATDALGVSTYLSQFAIKFLSVSSIAVIYVAH
jgi:hypothetical protein